MSTGLTTTASSDKLKKCLFYFVVDLFEASFFSSELIIWMCSCVLIACQITPCGIWTLSREKMPSLILCVSPRIHFHANNDCLTFNSYWSHSHVQRWPYPRYHGPTLKYWLLKHWKHSTRDWIQTKSVQTPSDIVIYIRLSLLFFIISCHLGSQIWTTVHWYRALEFHLFLKQ